MVTLILRQCVSTGAWITAFAATSAAAIAVTIAVTLAALLASAPYFNASAADAAPPPAASSWDGDARAAVRLLAGADENGGSLRAGVEVRLADGWKTYWRYPGDSGVPPVFDFSKSENIKSVSILWPAPHRFAYEGGASIGYKGDVIFPIHVAPNNPGRPATLRLTIEYAVCEKLCIPAHGRAELALSSAPSLHDARLAAAEARTPKPAMIGEAGTLGITAVRREPANPQQSQPHPRIIVEAAAPAAAVLDLFAEGPTADWALPLPEPLPGAPPGRRWFVFDLDGAPPGVDGTDAPLRFTLVSDENAVEVVAVPK
jgi:DsbC/DsbD-like thiol-disulfide interchange protein